MVDTILFLAPPKNRIEEISYQTILPKYYATILQEYENISAGSGQRLMEMIKSDIENLCRSKSNWINHFGTEDGWEAHLQKCRWNINEFSFN